MTTTLTLSQSTFAKINSLLAMKSLSIKMIALLFIVSLISSKVFGQSGTATHLSPVLKPLSHRASTNLPLPIKPSTYTIFLVKNFPILNTPSETLLAMEENELACLEMLCATSREKKQIAFELIEVLDTKFPK